MKLPLVSCITPTTDARAKYRPVVDECFHFQTYPRLEWIVEDGPGLIGGKRNKACERCSGEIICHFDDDDWSSPDRVYDQVTRLMESDADIIGYNEMEFRDEIRKAVWLYDNPRYALGTSLCYWKSFWSKNPFPNIKTGSDMAFQRSGKLLVVPCNGMMWARIHSGNTSIKYPGSGYWSKVRDA
jgi:hypothetical protein